MQAGRPRPKGSVYGAAACRNCVMLNKEPYVVQAVRRLDDILRRMTSHQSKKRPLLRRLRTWDG